MSSLRQEMPETAALIDWLRAAFGAPMIDAAILSGKRGQGGAWFYENGRFFGSVDTSARCESYQDERGVWRLREPGWVRLARRIAKDRGIEIRRAEPFDAADFQRESEELRTLLRTVQTSPLSNNSGA